MQNAITLLKNESTIPLSKQKKIGYLNLGDKANDFFNLLSRELDIFKINKSNYYNQDNAVDYEFLIISFLKSNDSPWVNSQFSKRSQNSQRFCRTKGRQKISSTRKNNQSL